MATVGVLTPRLENLFKFTERNFTQEETRRVFEDSNKILNNLPRSSLYEWLLLLLKQGQISKDNVVLIRDYLAKQSSNREEIEREVDEYVNELPEERPMLTGRYDEIERIVTKLRTDESAVVNLYGVSGVGKTALAKEICYRWDKESLGRTLIVDLREVKEMKFVYFNILQALEPNKTISIYEADKAVLERVRELTKEDEPVLVLLNNSEQFAENRGSSRLRMEFLNFLKRLKSSRVDRFGKLRILLTSRNQFIAAKVVEDIYLMPLEKEQSGELLKSAGEPSIAEEQKTKLLKVCGGRPLLINTAAAALRQEQIKPEQLVCKIEEEFVKVKGTPMETVQPSGSEKPEDNAPDRTTSEDLEADIQDTSFLRPIFLNLLSKELQNAAVSLSLFCHPFSLEVSARILGVDMDKATFLLESLRSYNFISPGDPQLKEPPTYDIHPMLKALMKDIKREDEFKQVFEKAETRLSCLFREKATRMGKLFDQQYADIYRIFDAKSPDTVTQYDEVAMSVFVVDAKFDMKTARNLFRSWAEFADSEGKDCLAANMRCWEAQKVLEIEGSHKALEVLKKVETSLDKADGKDTDMFRLTEAKYRFALGKVYLDLYQEPKRAIEEYLKSFNIMDQLWGDHTETVRCLNAIGNCYQILREPRRARDCFRRAYEMRERLSGDELHYDMPVLKSQIGAVFDRQGDYDRAIKYYQSAIDLEERLGISGSECTAAFYRNIANAYLQKDEYAKALEPATKAYIIRNEILGKHPETTRSLFQLGLIWNLQNKEDEALCHYKEAWEMEKSLQAGHHSVVRDRIVGDLRDLYDKLRRKKEKKLFEEDALEFYCKIWKEEKSFDHFQFTTPSRKITNMIIDLHKSLGSDKAEMKSYQEEALGLYEKTWQERDTLPELKWDKAWPLDKNVIKMRDEILKKTTELAQALRNEGKVQEFERERLSFYRDVLFAEGSGEIIVQLETFAREAMVFCERKWKEMESKKGENQTHLQYETIITTLKLCKIWKNVGRFLKGGLERKQGKALPLLESLWKEKQNDMIPSLKQEILDTIVELAWSLKKESTAKQYTRIKQKTHRDQNVFSKHRRFEKALQDAIQESANSLRSNVTPRIYIDKCDIDNEKEFLDVLQFLRNQEIVAHFEHSVETEYLVFLEPQWLLNTLKESEESKLQKKGASEPHVSSQSSDQPSKALVSSMEKLFVVCRWPSPMMDECIVPQMLTPPLDEEKLVPLLSTCAAPPLYIKHPRGSNLQVLFLYLLMYLFKKNAKEQLYFRSSKLYQNVVRLHLDQQGTSLVLLCNPSVIKVVLCTSDSPKRSFVGNTCRRWLQILKNLGLECCWLKDTSYELCFFCPVCEQSSCSNHGVTGCNSEECSHFYSEKELQKRQIVCLKSIFARDPRVSTHLFSPWLDEHYGEQELNSVQGGPSEKELDHLSKEITLIWPSLGIQLGLKQATIDGVRSNNVQYASPKEKAHQMLLAWKQGRSSTYDQLCIALREVERDDLAEKFCNNVRSPSNSRQQQYQS